MGNAMKKGGDGRRDRGERGEKGKMSSRVLKSRN
jgi:hypothetical protein